ncbi:DUF1611 domain-containing protein [Caulobacter sp. KR2-114]|uniref:DUF1611 domain-containing protein n=1 Tax=Caulobacter sp. KR2-114 TaxID=3400912 RepID=UPI003BFD9CBE
MSPAAPLPAAEPLAPQPVVGLPSPFLVFLGEVTTVPLAKTAFGVRDWRGDDVVGQARLPGCGVDLGVDELTPAQAAARGARALLIGVAPIGGGIPPTWIPSLLAALEAGLDLISGLHARLRDIPAVREAAARLGRRLYDVRHADQAFPIATGARRSGRRLLTVGTDCALGKKYAALAIAQALRARGVDADFRATGQTGIMIAGQGVAIDAVVADFVAGAAETLSPDAAPDHWDVIEGQGSLFHPAYAGVSLGLLHGSQPDALVVCHDPTRTTLHAYPGFPVVSLAEAIARNAEAARLTNPAARVVGISLNTASLDEASARAAADEIGAAHGVPCFDPLRFGLDALLDRMLAP